jgi:hypothetical protein
MCQQIQVETHQNETYFIINLLFQKGKTRLCGNTSLALSALVKSIYCLYPKVFEQSRSVETHLKNRLSVRSFAICAILSTGRFTYLKITEESSNAIKCIFFA